jgi:plasmid stabilization system protein ParE
MRLRVSREADEELTSIARWYEQQRAGLGEEFVAEALDAYEKIRRHPLRYPRSPARTSHHVRQFRLDTFPHAVIYEIRDEEILVAAIAHPSRKLGYWRKRLH